MGKRKANKVIIATRVSVNLFYAQGSVKMNCIFGKQTLLQLSEQYGLSISSIHRHLKSHKVSLVISSIKQVVVLTDATYWDWRFGVIVFKDWRTKRILWRKFIYRKETLSDYKEGVEWLKSKGFQIDGLVCDGLRGMFQLLSNYRVQMCIFHQYKILERYLPKQPEREASKELLAIIKLLAHTDKESFIGIFEAWKSKWEHFLKERYTNPITGKSHYIHKCLRSAYLSQNQNKPYL